MHVQVALVGMGSGLLGRGLYVLPTRTAENELVIFAVTSQRCMTRSGLVPLKWGSNLDVAAELLAEELEASDPVTQEVRRDMLRVS